MQRHETACRPYGPKMVSDLQKAVRNRRPGQYDKPTPPKRDPDADRQEADPVAHAGRECPELCEYCMRNPATTSQPTGYDATMPAGLQQAVIYLCRHCDKNWQL